MNTSPSPRSFVDTLMAADRSILRSLSIGLSSVRSGEVALSLKVTSAMVNSQNICHGGFLFTLADTASAYTVGSLGCEPATSEAQISYVAPVSVGDKIIASGEILQIAKKLVYTAVTLKNQRDEIVALFRATTVIRG
jgi:acyl-CoA thioesterase